MDLQAIAIVLRSIRSDRHGLVITVWIDPSAIASYNTSVCLAVANRDTSRTRGSSSEAMLVLFENAKRACRFLERSIALSLCVTEQVTQKTAVPYCVSEQQRVQKVRYKMQPAASASRLPIAGKQLGDRCIVPL